MVNPNPVTGHGGPGQISVSVNSTCQKQRCCPISVQGQLAEARHTGTVSGILAVTRVHKGEIRERQQWGQLGSQRTPWAMDCFDSSNNVLLNNDDTE